MLKTCNLVKFSLDNYIFYFIWITMYYQYPYYIFNVDILKYPSAFLTNRTQTAYSRH